MKYRRIIIADEPYGIHEGICQVIKEHTIKEGEETTIEYFEAVRVANRAELQALHNQQQQDTSSRTGTGKFIKFTDGQRRRLSFTGQFEKKQIQNKDFSTGQLIPDSFSTRYFFSVYHITDTDHPQSELSIWERGLKEAKTVFFWLSKNQKILDIERHGKAGDKLTSYNTYPPMD